MRGVDQVKRILCTSLFVLLPVAASALLLSRDELCAQGDIASCIVADLEKKIDSSQFGVDGKYEWRLSSEALAHITPPANAKGRAVRTAQELCIASEKVWISREVED